MCNYCCEVFNLGGDSIILHLHHGGKFVKERKLKYEGGSYRIIEHVDVDRLSYFELKGIACEKIGYAGLLDFFYVIFGCSMESGLRRLFTDEESIEMLKHCMGKKEIHVYTIHEVGEPELLPDALSAPGDQCHGDQTNPQLEI